MQALVTEDIRRDVINVDHGWWFPEQEGPDHGVWESNANLLTSSEPPYDPAFGTYQLRGLLCNLRKELQVSNNDQNSQVYILHDGTTV